VCRPSTRSTSDWEEYRHVLAMSLSDRDWDELPTVMQSMEPHRRLITAADPGATLSADALNYIALSIRAACERLKKTEPLTD
jgi:hypothetical protein